MSNRNSERRASERHTMNVLTEYLKEREGLNLKDRKEFDPPDPDFIVRVEEESIGVEVTDFSTQGDRFESNSFLDKALIVNPRNKGTLFQKYVILLELWHIHQIYAHASFNS